MGITVIVVRQDGRSVASSLATNNTVVVENLGGLRHVVRGRRVSKVILVDLKRSELNGELADTIQDATKTHELETGAPVPYLEV